MRTALAVTLSLYALVLALAVIRYSPPAPAPADAPPTSFSAARARAALAELVGDGATRWVGTAGNARGREVVAAELSKAGWTVEARRPAMSCTHFGMCASVTNVVARLPGREHELPGVLLTAHGDSAPVSPGASDDGFGVSVVIETARALAAGPKPRRTVIVVITDGEESGLLGADAFVRADPLAAQVKTTINVDARGDRGPSVMFETSPNNAWLVAMMASHLPRPVTTSLFYEVYRRMPNDTDFTVTKRIAAGLNFANLGGIENYHSPHDSLDRIDPRTLQDHGDHVLAMARALAEEDVGARSDEHEDAVWFDVLALGIVRWPASWSLPLAIGALVLVLLQMLRARVWDRGLAAFVALPCGLAATGLMGAALRAAGAFPAVWIAHPEAALATLHAAAALGVLAPAAWLARRSTPRAMWAGVWAGWGVLGIAAAAFAPGVSYLFVVPTLVAGAASALPPGAACAAPAVAASVLVLGLTHSVYDALGFVLPALVAVPTLLLCLAASPMLVGLPPRPLRAAGLALVAAALVTATLALAVPKFTPDMPRRVNVVFRQDADQPDARAFVDPSWGWSAWGDPPAAMFDALGGTVGRGQALPWSFPAAYGAVPRIDAPPPAFEVLAVTGDDPKRVRARVRSPRGADSIALVFPPDDIAEATVHGRSASPRRLGSVALLALFAVPAEGEIVELAVKRGRPVRLTLFDWSFGLPAGSKAEAAAKARALATDAMPTQDGDVTVLTRAVDL